MSIRRVYFENGTIVEQDAGKNAFKRTVLHVRKDGMGSGRVWFHNCPAWRAAVQEDNKRWELATGIHHRIKIELEGAQP